MQEEIRFARNTCSRRWFVAYKIHVDSRFISKSCDRWWQVFALYMENRARILFTLLSTHAVLKLFFLLTIRVEKLVKMIKRAKVICIYKSAKVHSFVKRFIAIVWYVYSFFFFFLKIALYMIVYQWQTEIYRTIFVTDIDTEFSFSSKGTDHFNLYKIITVRIDRSIDRSIETLLILNPNWLEQTVYKSQGNNR